MRNLLGLILVLAFVDILGQEPSNILDNDYIKIINDQLTKSDASKIKKLDKEELKAQDYLLESDMYYEKFYNVKHEFEKTKSKKARAKLLVKLEKYEKEALGNKVDGLIKYCEIYAKKYYIYSEDVQKLLLKASQNNIDSLKKMESIATSYFKKADLNVQLAYHAAGVDNAFNLTAKARKIEELGLLYIMKMYSIMLKFEHIIIDKKIKILESKEKTKNNVNIKDSVEIKTVVVYDTVKVENSINLIKEKNNIIFKIQIAASKKPLGIEHLNKICKSNEIIHSEYNDKWYKYYIGFYETYKDAQEHKFSSGVSDAFIIAYKNGKRISMKEFKRYVNKNK